jgi:hypothetical protein
MSYVRLIKFAYVANEYKRSLIVELCWFAVLPCGELLIEQAARRKLTLKRHDSLLGLRPA